MQLRKQAVKMRKKGMTFVSIAELLEVHHNTVSKWWNLYEGEGIGGIQSQQRGRQLGEHRTLTADQEQTVQKLICDRHPEQYKLTFALWTRQAVQEIIKLKLGITMPIRTVGEYLKRWGFTPQKPLRRAYEQRPKDVQQWLDREYPKIVKQAKQEKAEIHWGDETGIRSDCQHGRSYAPKGKTPEILLSAKRASTNMISTVTNQGKVRFMIYSGTMDAQRFIKCSFSITRGNSVLKRDYLT